MISDTDLFDPCELGRRAGAAVVDWERWMRRAGYGGQADEISLALYHAAGSDVVIAGNALADNKDDAFDPSHQAQLALASLRRERDGDAI